MDNVCGIVDVAQIVHNIDENYSSRDARQNSLIIDNSQENNTISPIIYLSTNHSENNKFSIYFTVEISLWFREIKNLPELNQ